GIRDGHVTGVQTCALPILQDAPDRPLAERLREYLRSRHVLLVLDNFEHLPAAAPEVAALLASGPRLKVLATSRAPLHLRWEHERSEERRGGGGGRWAGWSG